MGGTSGWCVLFLTAISPGQVVRYLERKKRTGEPIPSDLLLSDPCGIKGQRALVGGSTDKAWMQNVGPRLSKDFDSRVTSIWSDTSQAQWGYAVWANAEEVDSAVFVLPSEKPRGAFAFLMPKVPVSKPEIDWAKQNGLSLDRVPALRSSRNTLPVVDYNTVARLDQKSLLVENSPRLYRFTL